MLVVPSAGVGPVGCPEQGVSTGQPQVAPGDLLGVWPWQPTAGHRGRTRCRGLITLRTTLWSGCGWRSCLWRWGFPFPRACPAQRGLCPCSRLCHWCHGAWRHPSTRRCLCVSPRLSYSVGTGNQADLLQPILLQLLAHLPGAINPLVKLNLVFHVSYWVQPTGKAVAAISLTG